MAASLTDAGQTLLAALRAEPPLTTEAAREIIRRDELCATTFREFFTLMDAIDIIAVPNEGLRALLGEARRKIDMARWNHAQAMRALFPDNDA